MDFSQLISTIGYSIEAFGVLVILLGSIASTYTYLKTFRVLEEGEAYRGYKRQLGRSIMLGLEFLIAGDIIRTVVVENTLQNVSILALIILMRTFLNITLFLEVEGRWPWQKDENKE